MDIWALLEECIGFDWDDGNLDKNWESHRVAFWEAEEVFFNAPLLLKEDVTHSKSERRLFALGITNRGRRLFVSFVIRGKRIRPISARDKNRREETRYEHHSKEDPSFS